MVEYVPFQMKFFTRLPAAYMLIGLLLTSLQSLFVGTFVVLSTYTMLHWI